MVRSNDRRAARIRPGLLLIVAAGLSGRPALAERQAGLPADAGRERARSLAAAGNLPDALAIYDALTAAAAVDPALYAEAMQAAKAARDMRRMAAYGERLIKVDPANYDVRSIIPLAYRLAGDERAAEHWRADVAAYWKSATDPGVRSKPALFIDAFRAGSWMVNVIQCLEVGGDFGVGYVFDVWGPKAPPLPVEELRANHRERIVLEHNRLDQKILSEMTHTQAPMRPTLDALDSGGHATLKWFDDEPAYAVVREIVGRYVAGDAGLAAKPPMGGRWAAIDCARTGG